MEDLQTKLARLEDKAAQRAEAEKQKRRDNWNRVQQECPDFAGFLTEFGAVFGKGAENLAGVDVKILETGEVLKLR